MAADELALPLAAHDLEYVPEVPSTCVQPGTTEHWHCSVCGGRFVDESGAQAVKLDELALPLGAHALGGSCQLHGARNGRPLGVRALRQALR